MRQNHVRASFASFLNGTAAISAMAAVALATFAVGASAAEKQEARQEQAFQFNVPAGALSSALLRFGMQSGLQFNIDSRLTEGKSTSGLRGKYSAEGGLARLLSGTGLTWHFAGPRTVVIEALPEDVDGARVVGTISVEGAGGGGGNGVAVNGINGSSDITATEGTHSYTSGLLSVAGKSPMSIKDTAQSVSVVTQQQMQDQNITDFNSLMKNSAGISSVLAGSLGSLEPTFYSRGFQITRMQVDGGAPLNIAGSATIGAATPIFDMSLYDHAEILRGADGLFNGYGDPGGVINLTRKRPLDHFQAGIELQAGSWDNYRASLDLTGPLAFDGRLRARGVVTWQDQDYFYDTASSKKKIGYLNLEYQPFDGTILNAGLSLSKINTVPFVGGLPRFNHGDDLKLPRSTSFAFPWNNYAFTTKEYFANLSQDISNRLKLKVNLTRTKQDRDGIVGSVSGAVLPSTLKGPRMGQNKITGASTQNAADFNLDGSFMLFGQEQKFVVGGNYASFDGDGTMSYGFPLLFKVVDVDIFHFNPASFAQVDPGLPVSRYPRYRTEQIGGYANLRLTPWEPLHVTLGWRYSRYKFELQQDALCNVAAGCTFFGVKLPAGGSLPFVHQAHTKTDWKGIVPQNATMAFDLTKSMSVYGSYTSIWQDQSNYHDKDDNPLDPLTGSNIEAGIKWAPNDGALNATLSVYRIKQKNFARLIGTTITNLGDGRSCCYTSNRDMIRFSQGIDAEVTGAILPGWQVSASYTYNDNKEKGKESLSGEEGTPLESRFPHHLFKLWTSYQFQGEGWLRSVDIGAGAQGQTSGYYKGLRCTNNIIVNGVEKCTAKEPYGFPQPGYVTFSARAGYRINDNWSAAVNINNIFDKRYYQTVGTPDSGNWYGEPRNVMATLRGQF